MEPLPSWFMILFWLKKLNSIIVNTDNASKYLAENMEALQPTFLLKKTV